MRVSGIYKCRCIKDDPPFSIGVIYDYEYIGVYYYSVYDIGYNRIYTDSFIDCQNGDKGFAHYFEVVNIRSERNNKINSILNEM